MIMTVISSAQTDICVRYRDFQKKKSRVTWKVLVCFTFFGCEVLRFYFMVLAFCSWFSFLVFALAFLVFIQKLCISIITFIHMVTDTTSLRRILLWDFVKICCNMVSKINLKKDAVRQSSLRKFYGRYGDLTKQYEVPLSRMLHDILDDDHILWHPPLIGHYTNFWPLLIWTLLPNLTFYLIVQGFHTTYATGAACQQRTLTPPDTWSCPTLGLACVLMSRPISPELVLSPDFWISNIPRYFCFALKRML